tara:strand:- start:348 stop:626 length:279 start_codon:yes stop_codon:yes gene_type:complete
MKIKPLNRHIVVEREKEKQDKKDLSGFVVPEEFRAKDQYSIAKILAISEDSKLLSNLSEGDRVVVETSMLFQIKGVQMILENYIYGLIEKSG